MTADDRKWTPIGAEIDTRTDPSDAREEAMLRLLDAIDNPRCQHFSPTPWGEAQCALPLNHASRHAYDPSERGADQ